jgi:hypothetical protein
MNMNRQGSNEGIYRGKNSVVKYAGKNTTRFGINNIMLPRIAQMILAKETQVNGIFELYVTGIRDIGVGTPSRSQGAENLTTMFQVLMAMRNGHKIGEIQIND